MVIFHSYVSLPEGTSYAQPNRVFRPQNHRSQVFGTLHPSIRREAMRFHLRPQKSRIDVDCVRGAFMVTWGLGRSNVTRDLTLLVTKWQSGHKKMAATEVRFIQIQSCFFSICSAA
jgi:hypothetical protein